ncbi:hypothetical protein M426DRAFT_231156 [Hypoxylon sp. CI-4A]|nr:hypothetical protein M426DRAFT_231156 [Hypoxylon sp. CI-4A]
MQNQQQTVMLVCVIVTVLWLSSWSRHPEPIITSYRVVIYGSRCVKWSPIVIQVQSFCYP